MAPASNLAWHGRPPLDAMDSVYRRSCRRWPRAAYEKRWPDGGDLAAVLADLVDHMPEHLQRRAGQLWVANPACEQENYADRYAAGDGKDHALRDWLRDVAGDLGKVTRPGGLQIAARSIDDAFGLGLGPRVIKRIGDQGARDRVAGRLGSTSTGLLTPAATRPHRPHTNYGQPTAP